MAHHWDSLHQPAQHPAHFIAPITVEYPLYIAPLPLYLTTSWSRAGLCGVFGGFCREGRVEMSQLDGSSDCDSDCVVSYCQFANVSRCVQST